MVSSSRAPRPLLRLAVVGLAALLALTCSPSREARRSDDGDRRDDDRQSERGDRRRDGPDGAGDDGAAPGAGVPARDPSFRPETTLSVHLLDVGQGAATLLELPCAAILIDTGGELNDEFDARAAIKTQLEAFFARRTDLNRRLASLVISHHHIDHLRGVGSVFDVATVERVVDNGHAGDELVATELALIRRRVAEQGLPYHAVSVDELTRGGVTNDVIDAVACPDVDPKIRALWGGVSADPGWGSDNYGHSRFDNENNHSVVLRVDFG